MRMDKEPSLIGTVVGLICAPKSTCEILLKAKRPRHVVSILALLYLIILAPIVITSFTTNQPLYNTNSIAVLFAVFTIGLILFIIFEYLFLRLMAVKITIPRLTAAIVYSLIPLIGIILAMYVLNYCFNDNLIYISFVLNGLARGNPAANAFIPWILYIGAITSFLIYFFSLHAISEMLYPSSFITALLSVLPMALAALVASLISSVLIPGSVNKFISILQSPTSILGV